MQAQGGAKPVILDGVYYDLEVIRLLAKQAPQIEVPVEEINTTKEHNVACPPGLLDDGAVIVYKFHGKYIVFSGYGAVKENIEQPNGFFKARMMTKHLLKRARLQQ